MTGFSKDVSLELRALCSRLAEAVKEYYRDPAHRREFEEEYRQKHGKDYEWRDKLDSRTNAQSG